jgi:hypothetical protein
VTEHQLLLLNALCPLAAYAVFAYWVLDFLAKGRRPWDDTYFSRTITLKQRERDWDGD